MAQMGVFAMKLGVMNLLRGNLRHIELVAAEVSEGIIILDNQEAIIWANAAALTMHGVNDQAALGQTIDEYHENFQVKFRKARRRPAPADVSEALAADRLRDSLIEITPASGDGGPSLHRMRKLNVPDESGGPRYTVLFMTTVPAGGEGQGMAACTIKDAPCATAILRCRDARLIEANAEFERFLEFGFGRQDPADVEHLIAGADNPTLLRDNISKAVSFPYTLVKLADHAADCKLALLAGQRAEFNGEACMVLNLLPWNGLRPVVAAAVRLDPATIRGFAAGLCAAAPGPAYVLDADTRILAASQIALDWLGVTSQDVIGRKITDFMANAAATQFSTTTWNLLAAGGTVRDQPCQFIGSGGHIVDAMMSANATPDEESGTLWTMLVTTDSTQRRQSEDCFSKLMAFSPTPIVVRRMEDNRILDVNDAFAALTGYAQDAIVGHCADEFWHFAARAQRSTVEQDLRAGKRLQKIDTKLKTSAGDLLDASMSGEVMQVFGQNCAVLAFQDVTDRRRGEAELFEAIETVMEDTTWFTQSVIEKMASLRRPSRMGTPAPEIGDLTPREREVLGFISHGMTDTDIADKLGLTRCTVRNHVATLYSKIGVHSRSSAIVWARERGVNLSWPMRGPPSFMREAPAQRRLGASAKSSPRP
jgi:PAS domain S-box-containing protein